MITGLLRINCAICHHQVDEITHNWDPMRRIDIVEVKCHGDVDRCELHISKFLEHGIANIVGASQAFTTRRLA